MSLKVLSLSLDQNILKEDSAVRKRQALFGTIVDQYVIVIPNPSFEKSVINPRVSAYGSGGSNKIAQLFKTFQLVKNILKTKQFDLITVQDTGYIGFIAAYLGKKNNLPVEVQLHGYPEKNNFLRKKLFEYIIPHVTLVRVVSQRLRKTLVENLKIDDQRIEVLPILSERVTYARNYSESRERFTFLTVGRLVPVKNIDLQMQAMVELVKKYSNVRLVMVGEGSERASLEKMIQQNNLKDYVELVGWKGKAELIEYYKQTDCFLLTSNSEGWGMVVIEAAQYGLPIIMTDVGCAGEVIVDNVSGKVIPIGNLERLVQAMEEILKDHKLRERLGKVGQQKVLELPTFEEVLPRYREIWVKAVVS